MQQLFVGPETARVLRAGPLGEFVDGFVEVLGSADYESTSIHAKVLVVAQLGRWLARRRLGVSDLTEKRLRDFMSWRWRRYRAHRGAETTLVQLLRYLRTRGPVPPLSDVVVPAESGTRALIEKQYAEHLRAVPIRRCSTRRSIWGRCARWRSPGQEVRHDLPDQSRR